MAIQLNPIGQIRAGSEFSIELGQEYAAGLAGLEGFGHVVVIWYANQCPEWDPAFIQVPKPYKQAPDSLGIFATRSPYRPNGLGLSVASIADVDPRKGVIRLHWIDAEDGTPVLDLKPYHPSSDRIRDLILPAWCDYWPKWYEDSDSFAWEEEFLF